jgi:dynactin 1
MADLKLHDHVLVTTQNPPLEGVILHHGTVSFSSGNWIGIRLTGSSVGKGKNDGSVEGVEYFSAPDKGGLFMKEEKANAGGLEKRTLTKLEEMRFLREIPELKAAAAAAAVTGSTGSTSTRTTRASAGTAKSVVSPVRTRSRTSTGAASGATSDTPKSDDAVSERVRELRAKREALAKERKSALTPTREDGKSEETKSEDVTEKKEANSAGEHEESKQGEESKVESESKIDLSHATPGYRAELARLQSVITNLKSELQKKEAENASLQSSLDFMSKGAEQSTHDAVRMYAMGALALSEKKSPSAKVRTPGTAGRVAPAESKTPGEESARSLKDELAGEGSGSDSSESESDEEDDDNEQVVNKAAAAVSQALLDRNNELMSQLSEMASTKTNLELELSESQERIANMTNKLQALVDKLESEKQSRLEEQQSFQAEKSTMTSQLESLKREYSILQERASDKSGNVSEVSMAKLKAEVTTLQRKNADLENEKLDMEATLEELVLDKEALKEENEMMSDQLEEMKIDLESTQLELDDVKGQLQSGAAVDAETVEGAAAEGSDSDASQSLSLQNSRLRTAILRLREQTEQEKNELQKQLKLLQADSSSKDLLKNELEELKSKHATAVNEVQELKDMVDQTTSLEETIEILSDKVWTLEQENADLSRTIRELEESAEIAAEMEEVQSEELKAVMRDLEGRDALIRNLEEAIRMQKRREEDFQRYVSEFRSSISSLKQEKAALLALTEGEQGEKSHLIAKSQKAMAQAAQLAADASAARKRDCNAVFDAISARSATYLCQRLESLLPPGVVSAELAAVKGEIELSKVADKTAVTLSTLEGVFNKAIEKGVSGLSEFNVLEEETDVVLSDASSQQIATMIHQAEFASTVITVGSDALRFLAAGQWPELMSEELSADLGGVAIHSISQLDMALSEQLKLLKTEGVLSPLRSSLSELSQSAQSTNLALFGTSDQSGKPVIPQDWNPPGLEALKSLALGRFSCLGATAVLASAISADDAENEPPAPTLVNLASALEKAKQSCSNISDICKRFSGLRLSDSETVHALHDLAGTYETNSLALFKCIKESFSGQSVSSENVDKCSLMLEDVVTVVRQLSALLRKSDLSENDSATFHHLSPEFEDSWGGLTNVVAQVRAVDGDPDDVNYLVRARAIEEKIAVAVENEPELEKANAKIAALEKVILFSSYDNFDVVSSLLVTLTAIFFHQQSLLSRSKEIAMQNSRITELESLITKSSSNLMSPTKGIRVPGSPSPDTNKLKEEVRVLQEAVEVMEQQADEYQREIRALKEKSRTPRVSRQTSGRITPKKSTSAVDLEATINQFGSANKAVVASSRDLMLESISLETALFRPALASATKSASYWRAQSVGHALSKLTPLNMQTRSQPDKDSIEEVDLARNAVRLAKASFSLAEISNTGVLTRSQLNDLKQSERLAMSRLMDATQSLVTQRTLGKGSTNASAANQSAQNENLWGKIIVPCREDTGFVAPLHVSRTELRNLHSFLVQ